MSTLPPLEGLAAVIVAMRTGSFSAAAEELGVTHGAISRRIQGVEHWLGTALFERHARGVRATPAGQRFSREVEQALAAIGQSAERWRPRQTIRTVRISVVPSFAKLWLIPRLASLEGAPRNLRIDVTTEHRLANLEANDADLAIRYGAGRWPGVRAHLLFRETLFPVASVDVANRLGSHVSPGRLAHEPLLHDSDTSHWRAWLARHGLDYRMRAEDRRYEDYDLLLAAAEAGLGIALLRSPLADTSLQSGRLVRLNELTIENTAAHWIITRIDEERPAVLLAVERMLAALSGV